MAATAGSEERGRPLDDARWSHPIYLETDLSRIREHFRRGEWSRPTKGIAVGYTQAGLVMMPRSDAFEFLVFCQRNPKPCSVLDVTEVGDPVPRMVAPTADLRTDLPRYRIFRKGELVDEPRDIKSYWREDLVGFVLGCGATFDAALLASGVPIRQIEEKREPAIFWSNIQCRPSGRFAGSMAVSMRPMQVAQAIRAIQVTSRFPWTHGAPVHMGNPSQIGIQDIEKPNVGSPATIKPGEIPVFWACVATVWEVALRAKLEITITHAPNCMFITDLRDESLTII